MTREVDRETYAELYGPTTGDRVRLGYTDLFVEVEADLRTPGDEAVFGGGKTLRDIPRPSRSVFPPPKTASSPGVRRSASTSTNRSV